MILVHIHTRQNGGEDNIPQLENTFSNFSNRLQKQLHFLCVCVCVCDAIAHATLQLLRLNPKYRLN